MSQQNLSTDNKAPIEESKMSVEDTISFLASDDSNDESEVIELGKKPAKKADDKSPKKEAKSSDDSDDENDELDEDSEETSVEEDLEEELADDDKEIDEELELAVPARRKEILAKYPNIFKDFPYLEKAYYLERKYSELLPTIEDAQQAVDKSKQLDEYEKELMSGSTESILTAVRDNDKKAYARLVDNYLPTLQKIDENAYLHVVGNVVKQAIIALVQAGKDEGSDDFIQAADTINKFVFGTRTFTPPARMSKDEATEDAKATEISERERQFNERQFEVAKTGITGKIDNIIKSTVDKNIDPNDSMTDYVRRTATREVTESLESLIQKDSRFMTIYDRLWEKAAKDNFSQESMDRIKSAYLSKAKTLLPEIIKKVRNEAIKGINRKANSDNDNKDRKGPLPVGKTRNSASSQNSGKAQANGSKQPVPKGMSSLEYLMQD